MKTFLILLLISTSAFAQNKATEKAEKLEQRLLELEARQKAFERRYVELSALGPGRVQPFLGGKISLGGYFESAVTVLSGTDMPTQSTATGHILGINLSADFNEKMRFVTQFVTLLNYTLSNPHNNPNLTPSQRTHGAPSLATLVAQGYIEYVESEALVMQAGLGYMPFGQIFQQRDLVLLRRRGGPQMGTAASDLVFPLWMGLHLSGNFFSADSGRWGYNLYTFTPAVNPKALGLGGRLWKDVSDTLLVGTSLQQSSTTSDLSHTYGFDVKYSFENAGVVAEFARNEVNAGSPTPVSYYVEPFMRFNEGRYVGFVFADYMDNPTRMVGAVSDAFERWQYGGGINWLPIPNTRFRAVYTTSKYTGNTEVINNQGRDFENIDFSAGISF